VRWGARRAVGVAAGFTLAGGLLLVLASVTGLATSPGPAGLWSLIIPCLLYMLAHGVHQPCSQSGAVSPFPRAAGAASALNGFAMAVGAFFMGSVLGACFDGTARPMALGIAGWAGVIALVSWTLVRRHGDVH
jgi:DHA1 family bicyclomycin/chloramphenicol resistance-like MFS transporter